MPAAIAARAQADEARGDPHGRDGHARLAAASAQADFARRSDVAGRVRRRGLGAAATRSAARSRAVIRGCAACCWRTARRSARFMNAGLAGEAMRGARCGATARRHGVTDRRRGALHRALRYRPLWHGARGGCRPRHHVRPRGCRAWRCHMRCRSRAGHRCRRRGSSPAMSSSSMSTTAVSSSATTVSASFPWLGRCRTDERRDGDDGDGEGGETGARAKASLQTPEPRPNDNAGDAELLRGRNGGGRQPAFADTTAITGIWRTRPWPRTRPAASRSRRLKGRAPKPESASETKRPGDG